MQNSRLVEGVARAVYQVEFRLRPGVVQVPGGADRCRHVVASLDDDPWNILQPMGVAQQLRIAKKAAVHEIMIFDPGNSECKIVGGMSFDQLLVRQQRLPLAPGACRLQLGFPLRRGQQLLVGLDQITAVLIGDRIEEALPFVRKQPGGTILIVPEKLGSPQCEYPAHDQFGYPVGMGLCIGQGQRAAPGSAENQSPVDLELHAQRFDVVDKVPGGIGFEIGMRC